MPFICCPDCKDLIDYVEPVGDFSIRYLLCEPCAASFAKDIKRKAVRDALELGERLRGK